eukprot:2727177-Rhodomonas_salina.1
MANTAEQAWPQPGQKSSLGTHYVLKGPQEGRLILCVHGIGAYSACFDKLAAALVNVGYRVLQYDLMGRGWSVPANSPEHYDGDGHVAQLHQLLKELKLQDQPKDIIAHSMGGALAALYLAAYPPVQPSKLVLLSPAGLMNPGPIKPLRACSCMHGLIKMVLKSGQEGEWKKDFVEKKGENFEQMMQMQRNQLRHNPHSFNAFFLSALHFPLYGIDEQVSRVGKQPLSTFIMWGKHDKAVPMNPSLSRWEQHFPGMQKEIWDKAGHGFFLEQPERAATSIISFLGTT